MVRTFYLAFFTLSLMACSQAEDAGGGDSANSEGDAAAFATVSPSGSDDNAGANLTEDASGSIEDANERDPSGSDSEGGCTEGETQCDSTTSVATCIDGAFVATTTCPSEEACVEGVCLPTSCEPYTTRICIDEKTAALCNESGTGFDPLPCYEAYTCDPAVGACTCESPLQILFLLDASGSMGMAEYAIDGVTRWDHARTAIDEVMSAYPYARYGLKTFPEQAVVCAAPGCASGGGCAPEYADEINAMPGESIEVLSEYLESRQIAAPGSQLPLVLTPLVNAMESLVTADLGEFKTFTESPRYVVLLSDGEDTCYAPHAPELVPGLVGNAAASLRDDYNIYTYAVGFGYETGSSQLAAVAQNGGTGDAAPLLATDGAELTERLSELVKLIDPKQCTGEVEEPAAPQCDAIGATDMDGDGWCSDLDCNDNDASVKPGATEVSNSVDDDCDGDTDEPDGYIPPAPEVIGCQGIDFLFVVDNSASMTDEQEQLVASFPGFISEIQAVVPTGDYHIMVVDTDAVSGDGQSQGMSCSTSNGVTSCICGPAPECCEGPCSQYGASATCNGSPACNQPIPPALTECDNTLGAGRIYSGIWEECFVSPPRFITSAQPNLNDTFSCMGVVGMGGDGGERAMQAMAEAVTPPLSAAGGCNAGFLRSDSILVVTFITDEPEGASDGNVASWTQALIDAKNGNMEAVYVLGVFSDSDLSGGVCDGPPFGLDPAPMLRSFVEGFGEQGQACSICLPSYADCFAEAVGGIKTTCDNFVVE